MKRYAMIAIAGFLGLLVFPGPQSQGRADDDPAPMTLDAKIEQFWKLWETEQPSEALRRLSPVAQSPWANLYSVVDEYHSRLGGKCLGHAQIERKKITDRIEYVSFFEYYDVQPLRVEILYYKARDRWNGNGIACHVDINTSRWLNEIAHPQEGAALLGGPDGAREAGQN
jgi:hypothetical protein